MWHPLKPCSAFWVFLTPQTLSLLSLSSAGRLPRELLDFWTHCAQPPPRALRERLPPELEEERRKAETPSDIEVTTPSLLPEEPVCPVGPSRLPSPAHMSPRHQVMARLVPGWARCSSVQVLLDTWYLSLLSSPGPEGGPGAQRAPPGVIR